MSSNTKLFYALLLLALPACSSDPTGGAGTTEEPLGKAESAIINGTLESADYSGYVRLDLAGGGLCSGTLVTNDWVLTAAHCTRADTFRLYAPAEIAVSMGTAGTAAAQSAVGVEVVRHPTEDVALVRLASPFRMRKPGTNTMSRYSYYRPLYEGTNESVNGTSHSCHGYGWSKIPSPTGEAGNLHTATLPVIRTDDIHVVYGNSNPDNPSLGASQGPGDSGSSCFTADGSLVGVQSGCSEYRTVPFDGGPIRPWECNLNAWDSTKCAYFLACHSTGAQAFKDWYRKTITPSAPTCLHYQSWDTSKWTAQLAEDGSTFYHSPNGDFANAHTSSDMWYRSAGYGDWSVSIVGGVPFHTPRGGGQGHADVSISYLGWRNTARRAVIMGTSSFLHAPNGDFSNAHASLNIEYKDWNGSDWVARLGPDGKTFLHAPGGDFNQAHADTNIQYKTPSSGNWTARLSASGCVFQHAPDGDFTRSHLDNILEYVRPDGTRWVLEKQ